MEANLIFIFTMCEQFSFACDSVMDPHPPTHATIMQPASPLFPRDHFSLVLSCKTCEATEHNHKIATQNAQPTSATNIKNDKIITECIHSSLICM